MRIRRGVSGFPLPCGCLAGIYETFDGAIAQVIDARGHGCPHDDHRIGAVSRFDRREAPRIGWMHGEMPRPTTEVRI